MKMYSHPDKLLIEHLKEVAENCKSTVNETTWLYNMIISKDTFQKITYICGAFHDIGKATKFFQRYLSTLGKEIIGPKNHALISALFVYKVVQKYLDTTTLPDFERQLLSIFAYTATRRHHGGLQNIEDEVYLKSKSTELNEIIDGFNPKDTQEIINYFLKDLDITYDFNEFKAYIKSKIFENELPNFYEDEIKFGNYEDLDLQNKIQFFYLHQLIYSTLLLADKTDVIVDVNTKSTVIFPVDGVERYRQENHFNKAESLLDEHKNRAYHETIQNLKNVYSPNQYIYSLTLPTGLGKTILSLAVAFELRKLNPSLKRIIINIPFTSIIDQNYEVYKSIAATDDSSIILKHHHQAEPAYKLGNEDLEPNVSQFLIETWQSEVVVTTFVQLLNSIFSTDKSLLMKLPSLSNSIIILDEIQTIDFKNWQLINHVFKQLGSLLNCYFVLMSATQPLIFLPEKEIREIVPDYKSYFKLFNRTRIINKAKNPISLDDFVYEVTNYVAEQPKKDLLLILNTKASCLKVFEKLKETIDSEQCELYFMSTLITPYERKRIISFIKTKKSNKQQIVISTQLIEAGVDISVDTVFRVLAPIDAIIQAAGRGNRYNKKGYPCDVFIYEIQESIRGSQMVYGNDLLIKTKNVLLGIEEIEENNYLNLIEAYFIEIRKHSENYESNYLENIERLEFENLGQFSLIEQRLTESLFIQINIKAKVVWEEYLNIYKNPDTTIFEKRLKFGKIKSVFYDYVINVPVPKGEKRISFDNEKTHGFYLVEYEKPCEFYPYSDFNLLLNTGYQDNKTIML